MCGFDPLHYLTSTFRPQSNGLVEPGVISLRDVLQKLDKLDPETLSKVCFNVNNHVAEDGSGTPASRFLRRSPRGSRPNSIERQVEHRDQVRVRHHKMENLAKAKGRSSRDELSVGDCVWVQDHQTKKWRRSGVVVEGHLLVRIQNLCLLSSTSGMGGQVLDISTICDLISKESGVKPVLK